MKKSPRQMTTSQIESAIAMQKMGLGPSTIANRLGTTYELVKRALDPGYRRRRNDRARRKREIALDISGRPSEALLIERDRRLAAPPRSLTNAIMGDPPEGFSEFDRRHHALTI